MISCIRNNKGVTMVELIVVLIVLAVGIIPIAIVQTRANRDVFHSGQRTEALQVGHLHMERAKSLGFTNAVSDSGTAGPYTWQTDVQPAGFGLSEVTVTIQWMEGADQRQIQLSNLLSMR